MFLVLIVPAAAMYTSSWTTKQSIPTARRQMAVTAGDDGLIYIIGGFIGWGTEMTTVEVHEPTTDA